MTSNWEGKSPVEVVLGKRKSQKHERIYTRRWVDIARSGNDGFRICGMQDEGCYHSRDQDMGSDE